MTMSKFASVIRGVARKLNTAEPPPTIEVVPLMEAIEGRLLMSGDSVLAATFALDNGGGGGGGGAFTPDGRRLVVTIKDGPAV